MKTREQIITSMCYTWRHDYGLRKGGAEDIEGCDAGGGREYGAGRSHARSRRYRVARIGHCRRGENQPKESHHRRTGASAEARFLRWVG